MTLLCTGTAGMLGEDQHVRPAMTNIQPSATTPQEWPAGEPAASGSDTPAPTDRRIGAEPWGNGHPVNIRLSIPFFFARCYVTIVAGKERRSPERRADERQNHPVVKRGNLVFAVGCGLVCGLAMLSLFQLATTHVLRHLGVIVLP